MFRRLASMNEGLGVNSDKTHFDASDVISKIDAMGKKQSQEMDTTPFGLEDEDGNMVKVYVRADQAEDFEVQLGTMLAAADDTNADSNSSLEIAEILFKLKDKFDIVDVEWPGIEGDHEEEQEVVDPDATAPAATGDDADLDDDPAGGDDMTPAPVDTSGAESALSQVIDMMKSDAEAKKAEADARAAEARAKEAEYTAQASASKVRKEEQIYDMENAEKEKKEQNKEAEQMAKLARYQHAQAQDAEVKLSMETAADASEPEPWRTNDEKPEDEELTMDEFAALILRKLGHN